LQYGKINVSSFLTSKYEKFRSAAVIKNKANSNPIRQKECRTGPKPIFDQLWLFSPARAILAKLFSESGRFQNWCGTWLLFGKGCYDILFKKDSVISD
jgi:hypothetical protein